MNDLLFFDVPLKVTMDLTPLCAKIQTVYLADKYMPNPEDIPGTYTRLGHCSLRQLTFYLREVGTK